MAEGSAHGEHARVDAGALLLLLVVVGGQGRLLVLVVLVCTDAVIRGGGELGSASVGLRLGAWGLAV